jgi:hypothetical protein
VILSREGLETRIQTVDWRFPVHRYFSKDVSGVAAQSCFPLKLKSMLPPAAAISMPMRLKLLVNGELSFVIFRGFGRWNEQILAALPEGMTP